MKGMIKIYRRDSEYIAFRKESHTSVYLNLRALFNNGYWIRPKYVDISATLKVFTDADFHLECTITEDEFPSYEDALSKYPEMFL